MFAIQLKNFSIWPGLLKGPPQPLEVLRENLTFLLMKGALAALHILDSSSRLPVCNCSNKLIGITHNCNWSEDIFTKSVHFSTR